MKSPTYMDERALWRTLAEASERLLRASSDATLSELRGQRAALEELAREALHTSAAVPIVASAAAEETSATIENPVAAPENLGTTREISKTTPGSTSTALGTAVGPSVVRALALAKASLALRSTFPADEALVAALIEAAAREAESCPPDSRQALALAYLHAATYADGWRRASESLLRHLPADALTEEAQTLLAALEVAV